MPFTVVFHLVLLLQLPSVSSNMYTVGHTHGGKTLGSICFDYTQYVPVCGWQLIMTSSTPMTSLEIWAHNFKLISNPDVYTYILEDADTNADLQNVNTYCYDANIFGNFGNTPPSVNVDWYCVCTLSICESVPYTSLSPLVQLTTAAPPTTTTIAPPTTTTITPPTTTTTIAPPTTTTIAPPTTSTTITPPPTTTTIAAPPTTTTIAPPTTKIIAPPPTATATTITAPTTTITTAVPTTGSVIDSTTMWQGGNDATKMYLIKEASMCYVGTSSTEIAAVYHREDCHVICMDNSACEGVNYREDNKVCEVVLEDTDQAAGLLATEVDCEYWKVMWRV